MLPPSEFDTTKSSLPSPLKSPVTTEPGPAPKSNGLLSTIEEVGIVTSKKTTFEVSPPGLTTFTEALPGLAMSEEKIFAVNRDLLTKVVPRALPFQFTTEPETNPVPSTVSVNPVPPGLIASGNRGWLIR